MNSENEQEITLQLNRAGLTLSPGALIQVQLLWERYQELLGVLHAADLNDEEVSGLFLPGKTGDKIP